MAVMIGMIELIRNWKMSEVISMSDFMFETRETVKKVIRIYSIWVSRIQCTERPGQTNIKNIVETSTEKRNRYKICTFEKQRYPVISTLQHFLMVE